MKQNKSNYRVALILIALLLCCFTIISGVFWIGQNWGLWWSVLVVFIFLAGIIYLFFTLARIIFEEQRTQKLLDDFNSKLATASTAHERYLQTQDVEQLDIAVGVWEELVGHGLFGKLKDTMRYSLWERLGIAYYERFERLGQTRDLKRAMIWWRYELIYVPLDSPNYRTCFANLIAGLYASYEHTGSVEDLEEAIQKAEKVLSSDGWDADELASVLNTFSNCLRAYYEHAGNIEDLEKAISVIRQALDILPGDSTSRFGYMTTLGTDLRLRYQRMGRKADLEESIMMSQQVLTTLASNSPEYRITLNSLGAGLWMRYERTRRTEDLDAIIQIWQQAVNLTLPESYDRASYLHNLGIALSDRYTRTMNVIDLDKAIDLWQQAVSITHTNAPELRIYLNTLGVGLRMRYVHTGQETDLNESILVMEKVVTLTPPGSPLNLAALNNLGSSLRKRYAITHQVDDLEKAISLWKQVVQQKDSDSPELPAVLSNLGSGFFDLYSHTKQVDAFHESCHFYELACLSANKILGSHDVLFQSGRTWGNLNFEQRAWEQASRAYQYSMTGINRLFRVQLARQSKESWLVETQGVLSRLTFAQAKAGDLVGAIETLESGRARFLGEALERARRDLDLLADPMVGQVDLLERYRAASDHYNAISQPSNNFNNQALSAAKHLRQVEVAEAELEAVITEIRRVPGYETFLFTPNLMQIQIQARDTPLVYLITTQAGGMALVVTEDKITVLDLPELREDVLHKHVVGEEGQNTYLRTYLNWRADPYSDKKREIWKTALDETSHWLWDVLMQPLLSQLKQVIPSHDTVVLIPSEWLSLLPLHAAWTEDSSQLCGRRYALDVFTFTYAPSVLALIHARPQAEKIAAEKLLVVENPDNSLRFSDLATLTSLTLFESATHLSQKSATFESVQEMFESHNILYFFTHGIARFDEPLQSSLTLADKPLTLNNIFSLKTDSVRLAVLSACESGVPSNLDLLDEAVSLPSGLMQAGVPGVVGSQWAVLESSTAVLMSVFFKQWRREGLSAPQALRKAQIILRDAEFDEDAKTYVKASLPDNAMLSIDVDDILKNIKFAHPFYWAAFTFTGL